MPKVFKLQQLGAAIQQILNAVSGKAEQSDLNAHTNDGDVHVSTTEKSRWNDTYTKTQVDDRIEQGGKVKTVSVNGGSAVQPDGQGNIDIEVPTDLKDLNGDATHRTVTDEEKSAWSGKQPAGDYATRTELAEGLATKQAAGDYATNTALTEGLAGKQGTINDLEAIRSGAGKGATSVQGVKMEGDDNPLTPDGNGVVTIPQPEIPDSVTSVISNHELVLQTPDGQSVKGKVGITTGADGLLHLTLTDEEGHTYSSPIAGLRVNGNALQYSNDGETWVTVQTFGRLAIKYVQASDPASGDEGNLALVGSTNAYVLKVYVGGSWVSVCDFGTLDLTSDGITMAGESKTLTQKMEEVDGIIYEDRGMTHISAETLNNICAHSYMADVFSSDKTTYDHDIVVTKLIFNENIDSAEEDTEITYYIADPAATSSTLGTAYTATIVAGTHHADVNIVVPAGKIIYVRNKKVVDTDNDSSGYYGGCLISVPNSSANTTYSVNAFGTSSDTLKAAFNYEIRYKVGLDVIFEEKSEEFARKNSFSTGEKLEEVGIDEDLEEGSDGLVKSGTVFGVTHATVINRRDTPLLTGTIANSYINYIISAGKTVYDEDVNIVKLIFNENIKDSAADITVTYYIADPDATGLGTSHTATIVAGTNYAVVDFVLPAGKLIYVNNKDVFASGDSYPSGCLIAGNQSLGSEQSYYVLGGWHGNIYAGFSYEISKIVEIKEYVDRLNEETSDKIEDLSKNSASKNSVAWKDAKTVVVFGSSLTDQRYAPAGHIWLEEINHICDVNLINYALSGEALQSANLRWAKELDFSPTWILWNNEANGTPYGLAGYKLLCAAMEITQSKGAIMMLGGENSTAAEDNYPLKSVDKLFDVFAEEHHLCRSELRRERVRSLTGQTYPRFDGGIHYGWRNQAPFITKHLELLGNLPVSKSVKIYKVRPQSANLQVSALNYDTPLQRMKHFYALSTGVAYNGLYTTSQFDVVDNIKQGDVDNPQPYYANALPSVEIIKTRETEALLKGNDITIPNGKAVVEFTLEHTDVKSGIFKFKTSADSLQVYVSVAYNSSTEFDDSPRSTWQSVNNVAISSDDDSGYIVTANVAGVIELYDNVKFLVVASGEFTIKQPEFEYEGGMKKNTPVLNYKPRRYGVEVNDNLHVDENEWTLTGNAAIEQVPSTIGLYGADTYHIELSSVGDSAWKNVRFPAGTKKVAIRVMAQRFVPIMTKLFAGTPDADSKYVSDTQVINNYDNDLGVIDVVINDSAVSRHVICPGFAWNYIEYSPDLTDTSLKVEIRKPDDDTAPIMLYMLSVQVIE